MNTKTLTLKKQPASSNSSDVSTGKTKQTRKPLRTRSGFLPSKPASKDKPHSTVVKPSASERSREHTEGRANERIDPNRIYVYRLPPTGLAYQLAMAAHLLAAVGQGFSLSQLLAEVRIDEVARANVQRLTFDALRHWGATRFWLNRYVAAPPAAWIQGLLCVAWTQLLLREESEFTLVNEAVAAVDVHKPHAKGMVNALLRRFLRERDSWVAQTQQDEVATHNHPQWWIDALKQQYSDDWRAIITVNNSHPPMTLRVNARRYTRADYRQSLAEQGLAAQDAVGSQAALVLAQPCPVQNLPEFADGAVSVQDAGAQLSVQLLDLCDGQRVLDACAAPGGKTAHLLECHEMDLIALEKDPQRAQHIHQNLARLHLTAKVEVVDANNVHQWWDGVPFDRVLLDAPCSASGIVRRHPDIRWLRQKTDLVGLAQQQAALLRAMWKVLAVGGRLLYCTCSVFDAEGEGVIASFLQHTPNAHRLYPEALMRLCAPNHAGQLIPMAETAGEVLRNHDGFFYAILEKKP